MTAQILDGKAILATIKSELKERVAALAERGVTPGLGTVLVGDDPGSHWYVGAKHKDCAEIGIGSVHEHLGADATQDDVLEVIRTFNADPLIDAYLAQYPFPKGLDYESALLTVDPAKDVDGLHPVNLGLLVMGVDAPLPCTPHGIQVLLEHYGVPIAGAHVVIVGRGLTIGRPLANLLALKRPNANAAVTVVHTGVTDIGSLVREADVVVAAAGAAGLVTAEMVKPGAVVVGAGVTFVDGKVVSDVADEVAEVAAWITPRLGGVGPMTRAMLFANAVAAAERSLAR